MLEVRRVAGSRRWTKSRRRAEERARRTRTWTWVLYCLLRCCLGSSLLGLRYEVDLVPRSLGPPSSPSSLVSRPVRPRECRNVLPRAHPCCSRRSQLPLYRKNHGVRPAILAVSSSVAKDSRPASSASASDGACGRPNELLTFFDICSVTVERLGGGDGQNVCSHDLSMQLLHRLTWFLLLYSSPSLATRSPCVELEQVGSFGQSRLTFACCASPLPCGPSCVPPPPN